MSTVHSVGVTDPAFDDLFAVYRSANQRPFDRPYDERELRVLLRGNEYERVELRLLRGPDGTAVACGWVFLPQRDNTELGWFELYVHADRRLEGHGSDLLLALEQVVIAEGRTRFLGEAAWGADEDGAGVRSFAENHGFRLNLLDAQRVLPLPVAVEEPRVAEGYALRSWRGACPAELVEGYLASRHLMEQEIPAGDTRLENEFWDERRLRLEESDWREQGRVPQVSVAIAPDGSIVGHTQLVFSDDSPWVYQWDTLVLPAHRGHGLGAALKLRTMAEAADLLEGRQGVVTYNAATNGPMIAVNEALGYRLVAWSGEFLKEL